MIWITVTVRGGVISPNTKIWGMSINGWDEIFDNNFFKASTVNITITPTNPSIYVGGGNQGDEGDDVWLTQTHLNVHDEWHIHDQ